MGNYAHADLIYGVVFPSGWAFPWDEKHDDFEDWYLYEVLKWVPPADPQALHALQVPYDDDLWQRYFKARRAVLEAHPPPYEAVYYDGGCEEDFCVLALWQVSGSYAGEPVDIPAADLEADARFTEFLETHFRGVAQDEDLELPDISFAPRLWLFASYG